MQGGHRTGWPILALSSHPTLTRSLHFLNKLKKSYFIFVNLPMTWKNCTWWFFKTQQFQIFNNGTKSDHISTRVSFPTEWQSHPFVPNMINPLGFTRMGKIFNFIWQLQRLPFNLGIPCSEWTNSSNWFPLSEKLQRLHKETSRCWVGSWVDEVLD